MVVDELCGPCSICQHTIVYLKLIHGEVEYLTSGPITLVQTYLKTLHEDGLGAEVKRKVGVIVSIEVALLVLGHLKGIWIHYVVLVKKVEATLT